MDHLNSDQILVHNKIQDTYYLMNGGGNVSEADAKAVIPNLRIVKDTPVYTQYKATH